MIPAGRGCGALVDWMLAAVGVMPGAAAFAVGHLIAIAPYLRNRRPKPTGSQQLLVALTVPLALVIAWALTKSAPADQMGAAVGYTAIVAAMAACAWASRFPRYRTGLRSEEHTSELQSLMRISYAVFCLQKHNLHPANTTNTQQNNITKH